MLRALAAAVIGSMLCAAAPESMAVGFGRIDNATVLGRPLDFSAWLQLQRGEHVAPECVSAQVASGDVPLHPQQVLVRLDAAPGTGQAALRVRTRVRIDEPVVTVNLKVGCPPSLSREFVVFVDPPTAMVPQRVPEAATPEPAARVPPRRARRPAAAAATRSAPQEPAPRLMLDPPQASAPADPVVAAAPPPLADADPSAQAQRLARERERVLGLEVMLERLRSENAATQQQLADLQRRLREAEAARQSNPAVYGLGSIVVLLLAAMAALLWKQSRLRRQAAWWTPEELQAARESLAPPASQSATDIAMQRTVVEVRPPAPVAVPPSVAESAPAPLPPADSAPSPMQIARRELSVEELIDLEQQADFFVVLGQDDAAIDLLMGHVRSSGGASPMPYLKLLEIYRRRGEREAYERIRERFNRRFNAYAPDWETDPSEGRTLEGYADVMARLESQWDTPSQAMELLESLLFRRDSSDSTFDLPAYGELLFLYSHARDLAEHDTESGGVDLLLPLGHHENEAAFASLTGSMPRDDAAQRPVDVEIDADAQEPVRKS